MPQSPSWTTHRSRTSVREPTANCPNLGILVTFVPLLLLFSWLFPHIYGYARIGGLSWTAKRNSFMNTCPAPLIICVCKHILDSGSRCRGAAVSGRPYCRHHLESRLRVQRMARMRRAYPFPRLPLLADAAALHYASRQIDAGLSDGRIDPAAGPVLRRALQLAGNIVRWIDREEARQGRPLHPPPPNRKLKQIYQLRTTPSIVHTYKKTDSQLIENTSGGGGRVCLKPESASEKPGRPRPAPFPRHFRGQS
jgi:hypothetical protein